MAGFVGRGQMNFEDVKLKCSLDIQVEMLTTRQLDVLVHRNWERILDM